MSNRVFEFIFLYDCAVGHARRKAFLVAFQAARYDKDRGIRQRPSSDSSVITTISFGRLLTRAGGEIGPGYA